MTTVVCRKLTNNNKIKQNKSKIDEILKKVYVGADGPIYTNFGPNAVQLCTKRSA